MTSAEQLASIVTDAEGAARFWSTVTMRSLFDCWEGSAINWPGYSSFSYKGRAIASHRVAYRLSVGEVPAGHEIHHKCRNKACCNPAHLVALPKHEHAAEHAGDQRRPHAKHRKHNFKGSKRLLGGGHGSCGLKRSQKGSA